MIREGLKIIDLFAGIRIGGWDQTISDHVLGVEFDEWAFRTRKAVGLATLRADISTLDPSDWPANDLLIASPPCQGFSVAGKQDPNDPRNRLVYEPMRWIQRWKPRAIAFEQVPPVLPIWEWYCAELRAMGYSAWCGNLTAEMYGIPQTRKRAILMASLDKEVAPPVPTHSRYHSRTPERLDDGVLPWVSMAEALGWGYDGRPAPVVTGGGAATGGAEPFGNASRTALKTWMAQRIGPAFNLTEKARSWTHERPAPTLVTSRRSDEGLIVGRQLPPGEERDAAHGGWTMKRNSGPGADREPRPVESAPSYTIRANGSGTAPGGVQFVGPAPTLALSGSTSPVGGSGNKAAWMQRGWDAKDGGVRITLAQALILQGFPPDYPVQGKKTRQFLQVGNAIPPPLASAILRALLA